MFTKCHCICGSYNNSAILFLMGRKNCQFLRLMFIVSISIYVDICIVRYNLKYLIFLYYVKRRGQSLRITKRKDNKLNRHGTLSHNPLTAEDLIVL